MLAHFCTFIKYDIFITLRCAFSWVTPLLFFILVCFLFPFALGSSMLLLKSLAPGIIWLSALLAIVISMNQLFADDKHEGFLDQLLLAPFPLTLIVIAKIISHWIMHCLPLIVVTPLLGLILNLHAKEIGILLITLLLGTPVLTLLGAVGASLTVGLRNHGLLLPLLIMPLYIPILILGVGILSTQDFKIILTNCIMMLAFLLISLSIAPILTAKALRIRVSTHHDELG